MEASMILNLSSYSENILDVIKIFQQIGWDIYNPQGEVEYLPIGDDDMFEWQRDKISMIKLYDIILEKIVRKELVGVSLFYNDSVEGISLLANTTEEIMLSIEIYRRKINGYNTDMVWYLENIIYKLFDMGVRILSYTLREYED